MSTPRRSEHIQPGKSKEETAFQERAGLGAEAAPRKVETAPADEAEAQTVQDPVVAQKYWLAILLWAAAFGLLVLYEILAAIFRR